MCVQGGFDFATGVPSFFGPNITTGVNNGSLPLSHLDDMILRIMAPYYLLGQDSGYPLIDQTSQPLNFFPKQNYVHEFPLGPLVDVRKDHAAHIRKLGAARTVLLKNTNNALPLKEPKNIGVFGNGAADPTLGLLPADNQEIGAMAVGGGSGTGRLSYIVSPLEAIKAKANSYDALVQYISANWFILNHGFGHIAPAPPDVCLVFVKSWASEGGDRGWLAPDWYGADVVERTAAFCSNTIAVLHGAGPNVLPWKDHPNVTAILVAHMPGQETGNSIVDILWGSTNPSGKLPYTIANTEGDYNKNIVDSEELRKSKDPDAWQANFTEGNLIDYKEFDAKKKSVAYEFGFGLSYTTFELSDIKISAAAGNVSRTPSTSANIAPGGNVDLWEILANVTVTVKNTGKVAGATVPQLYISLPSEAGKGTPVRSLRGFEKVQLGVGKSNNVVFSLLRRDLSFWDVKEQTWRLPGGEIGVDVGLSSRDLKLGGKIRV
jgi:beta-glucosidase